MRGKPIESKYHVIREIAKKVDVLILKISPKNNLVNPFTKTLLAKSFRGHLEGLGLRSMSHLLLGQLGDCQG